MQLFLYSTWLFRGVSRRSFLQWARLFTGSGARPCLLQFSFQVCFSFQSMAQISPFQAWRYAPEHVSVSRVVTQPYDKITPEMQEAYYSASPYNLVRIILG